MSHPFPNFKFLSSFKNAVISYDIVYMCNLKKRYKWTDLQYRDRVIEVKKKLWVTKGKMRDGINGKTGTDIYTSLYIK